MSKQRAAEHGFAYASPDAHTPASLRAKEAHRPLHRDGSQSFPIRPASLLFPPSAYRAQSRMSSSATCSSHRLQSRRHETGAGSPTRYFMFGYVDVGIHHMQVDAAKPRSLSTSGVMHQHPTCKSCLYEYLHVPRHILCIPITCYACSKCRAPAPAYCISSSSSPSPPLSSKSNPPRGLPGSWDPGCDRHCRVWPKKRRSQSRTL